MSDRKIAIERFWLDGLATQTVSIEERIVSVAVRKIYGASRKEFKLSEVDPNYSVVKSGIQGGFSFFCYCLFFGVLVSLLRKHFFTEYALVLSGVSSFIIALGLIVFLVSHIRVNKRAVFSLKDGRVAFSVGIEKNHAFIEHLTEVIGK